MKSSPGFLSELYQQLEGLSLETLERVNREGGLEVGDMVDLITNPRDLTVFISEEADPGVIVNIEEISSEAFWRGKEILTSGEAAHCIICDESSLVRDQGESSCRLELQLMRLSWVKEVWVLTKAPLEKEVKRICDSVGSKASIILNYETFCLRPDNLLDMKNESPVLKSCGSGDLINSMRFSGVYDRFIQGGGKYIAANSGENFLGARPAVIGSHALSQKPVTSEITKRSAGQKQQPVLCEYAGFNQLVESFRFATKEQYEEFSYEDAGTLVFNANLDFDSIKWKWHRRKFVYDKKVAVQFERTLCDLTSNFQTQFIYTPRKYLK